VPTDSKQNWESTMSENGHDSCSGCSDDWGHSVNISLLHIVYWDLHFKTKKISKL